MSLNEWYDRVPEPYRFILLLIVSFPLWSLLWWDNYPTVFMSGCIYSAIFMVFVVIPRIIYVERARAKRKSTNRGGRDGAV